MVDYSSFGFLGLRYLQQPLLPSLSLILLVPKCNIISSDFCVVMVLCNLAYLQLYSLKRTLRYTLFNIRQVPAVNMLYNWVPGDENKFTRLIILWACLKWIICICICCMLSIVGFGLALGNFNRSLGWLTFFFLSFLLCLFEPCLTPC
jgi:hypothetical protein